MSDKLHYRFGMYETLIITDEYYKEYHIHYVGDSYIHILYINDAKEKMK